MSARHARKWREGLFREGFLVVPFSLLFSVEPTRSVPCRNSIQNLRNANECPIDEFIMTKLLECAKPKLPALPHIFFDLFVAGCNFRYRYACTMTMGYGMLSRLHVQYADFGEKEGREENKMNIRRRERLALAIL